MRRRPCRPRPRAKSPCRVAHANADVVDRYRPPAVRRAERHPNNFVDEDGEPRVLASRRDDHRQNDPVLGRLDAPSAGKAPKGPGGRRAARAGAHNRRASPAPRTRRGRRRGTSHRRRAAKRAKRAIADVASGRPDVADRRSSRRGDRSGIPPARRPPSPRARRAPQARRTARLRNSRRRRRRRRETGAAQRIGDGGDHARRRPC